MDKESLVDIETAVDFLGAGIEVVSVDAIGGVDSKLVEKAVDSLVVVSTISKIFPISFTMNNEIFIILALAELRYSNLLGKFIAKNIQRFAKIVQYLRPMGKLVVYQK